MALRGLCDGTIRGGLVHLPTPLRHTVAGDRGKAAMAVALIQSCTSNSGNALILALSFRESVARHWPPWMTKHGALQSRPMPLSSYPIENRPLDPRPLILEELLITASGLT